MTTYTNRSNAARAAKKAVEGTSNTYEVIVSAGGYSFTVIEPPATVYADDDMAMLTMGDTEYGLVSIAKAEVEAQTLADETGEIVTVRHAITDVVIGTVPPSYRTNNESDATMIENSEMTTDIDVDALMSPPVDDEGMVSVSAMDAVRTMTEGGTDTEQTVTVEAVVLPSPTFPTEAHAEAWAKADGLTKRQFEILPIEGGFGYRKIVKASKPVKAPTSEGPTGKVAECITLALRPQGVTAKELNELTGWNGAPWRWNFSNPKNTGWAQKHGYDFEAKKENGVTTYHLTAKAPEVVADAA